MLLLLPLFPLLSPMADMMHMTISTQGINSGVHHRGSRLVGRGVGGRHESKVAR
jgi:hypothetical protein